jgi:hypothetical protein
VEGFHVVLDPREMFALAGEDLGMAAAGLFESVAADAKATSIATKAIFDEAVARYGLLPATIPQPRVPSAGPSAIWCEETSYAPYLVPARARFFDLIVLGRSERVIREAYTDTIEQTLVSIRAPGIARAARTVRGYRKDRGRRLERIPGGGARSQRGDAPSRGGEYRMGNYG